MLIVKNQPEKPWPVYPFVIEEILVGKYDGKGLSLIEDREDGTSIGLWCCSPVIYRCDYNGVKIR